jgi:hypothetical protein
MKTQIRNCSRIAALQIGALWPDELIVSALAEERSGWYMRFAQIENNTLI